MFFTDLFDGVITKITQDDELGVVISQAVGNDYIVNYGQTINPEVKEGSFVEAGQTIAYVNQPTKYYSKEGDNIYFSVERNGKTKENKKYRSNGRKHHLEPVEICGSADAWKCASAALQPGR